MKRTTHGIPADNSVKITQNILSVKQQIDRALNSKQRTLYWESLSKFIKAKISKYEFDNVIRYTLFKPSILSSSPTVTSTTLKDFAKLHNQLIRSLLFNIRHEQFLASLLQTSVAAVPNQRKSRFAAAFDSQATEQGVTASTTTTVQLPTTQGLDEGVTWMDPTVSTIVPHAHHPMDHFQFCPTVHNSVGIYKGQASYYATASNLEWPTLDSLNLRIQQIAHDRQLAKFAPDCTAFVLRSVEHYLKTIISKMLELKAAKQKDAAMVPKNSYTWGSYHVPSADYPNTVHSYLHYRDDFEHACFEQWKHKRQQMETDDDNDNIVEEDDDDEDREAALLQVLKQEQDEEEMNNDDSFVVTSKDLVATVQSCPFLVGDFEKYRTKINTMDWDLAP